MATKVLQTQDILDNLEDEKFDEEWKLVVTSKGEYTLNKIQARILQQKISSDSRGIVMFKTFMVSIPYIVEFYRVKRFLRGTLQLPAQASELPYKPMSREKFEKLKKEIYRKIGKPIK